jgi:hypothetical protein
MKSYSPSSRKSNTIKMGWVLFLAGACLSAAAPLPAVEFGVKGGASLSFPFESTNAIHNIDIAKSLLGIQGGFFAQFPLGGLFFLQPEINYVMRGVRYYSAAQRSLEPVRFHYLEIPLLVNLSLKSKSISFFIGPYYGILLGSTAVDDQHDWTWEENRLKHSDFGLVAGGRWHCHSFFIELQYSLGLENVMFNANGADPYPPVHRHHGAALLIGYVF